MADRGAARAAAIVGLAGLELGADERALLSDRRPVGGILFTRNIASPAQVQDLVASFREAVGDPTAPLLVDQEGGRVARLRPPHWRHPPAFAAFGRLAQVDPAAARRAAFANARAIAADLVPLGIDGVCAPVLDLGLPDRHSVVGDRAAGANPALVAELALAAIEGFQAGGVVPVCKHFPGHGRALADSHAELPRVQADLVTLEADLEPFARAVESGAWWMTAHCLYPAYDRHRPATLSPGILLGLARGRLGFRGVLVSDDLHMGALSGEPAERAVACLAAGCDLALWCPGDAAGTRAVLEAVPSLAPEAAARIEEARARTSNPSAPVDAVALAREVEVALGTPVA